MRDIGRFESDQKLATQTSNSANMASNLEIDTSIENNSITSKEGREPKMQKIRTQTTYRGIMTLANS
jgi:hypothetical protein